MNSDELRWVDVEGTFVRGQRSLKQTSFGGAYRTYAKLDVTNFLIEFTFRIEEEEESQKAEAKFIFSDAKKGEEFRLDFVRGANYCRLYRHSVIIGLAPFVIDDAVHQVRVFVKDNLITVFGDGMVLFQNAPFGKPNSDGVIGFGSFMAKITFSNIVVKSLISKTVFVVMHYDGKNDLIYENVVAKAVAEEYDLDLHFDRADRMYTTGKITDEITEKISNADFIIADISDGNKNVFYELGWSHAKDKKVILIKEISPGKDLDLPFDIKDFRTLQYEFSPNGLADLQRRLSMTIRNVIGELEKVS